jgi:ribosome biogenesis GTPase
MSNLAELGYGPFFSAQFELLPSPSRLVPARVTSESHGLYQLAGSPASLGELSGKLQSNLRNTARPVTGDWLAVSADTERAVIHHVLDRRTLLQRRAASTEAQIQNIAANVDLFFIVTSANYELNPRRLERYITAVWNSGATPVIILNKLDLVDDASAAIETIEGAAPQVEILRVSALNGIGLDALRQHLAPGKTVGFIGSSGVGKSTLTNCLLGHQLQSTHAISSEGKGRHTTTQKQLVVLPEYGVLLDTPGLRELGIVDDGEGLHSAFSDIAGFSEGCRFRNCQHAGEPGCAVQAAIAHGALSEKRLSSYHKLKREIHTAQARKDPVLAANTKRRWKTIAKSNRKRTRSRD